VTGGGKEKSGKNVGKSADAEPLPHLHPIRPTGPARPSVPKRPGAASPERASVRLLRLTCRQNRPAGPAGSKGRIGVCAVSRTAGSGLARTLSLNRRARYRAIRAEHAAIALPRSQRRAATDTFVEELAGISRHGFRFGGSAMRAGDNAFKDHGAYLWASPRYSITICPSTVVSGQLQRRRRPTFARGSPAGKNNPGAAGRKGGRTRAPYGTKLWLRRETDTRTPCMRMESPHSSLPTPFVDTTGVFPRKQDTHKWNEKMRSLIRSR
jgi:hypothetical protein